MPSHRRPCIVLIHKWIHVQFWITMDSAAFKFIWFLNLLPSQQIQSSSVISAVIKSLNYKLLCDNSLTISHQSAVTASAWTLVGVISISVLQITLTCQSSCGELIHVEKGDFTIYSMNYMPNYQSQKFWQRLLHDKWAF